MAGKENNTDYIRENHAQVMEDYVAFREKLAPVFEEEAGSSDTESSKPVADEFLMKSIYEELLNAAGSMDSDMIEDIMKEADEYAIPESEKEKFAKVREKADLLDYDGIMELLK